jgi:hypothetical protein
MDCGIPGMARLLRNLLEGLGIDPDDLEVRIGVRQPGEPRLPRAEDTRRSDETKADTAWVAGQLLEARPRSAKQGKGSWTPRP